MAFSIADRARGDLSYAVRSLRRSPGFTITAVLILALGIGMASAMFTVFQSVVLRRLPVRDQEQIVTLTGVGKGAGAKEFPVLTTQYRRFRDQARTLSGVTGYAHWGAFGFPINDGDRPLPLKAAAVTANFFDVLGTRPLLGRLFLPADETEWGIRDATSPPLSIVISYGAWQRAFAGDSAVIGHRLTMPVTKWEPVIIGVAPPGLDFPRGVDYWMPTTYNGMDLVGRLAPGVTAEAARLDYFSFVDTDPEYAILGPHTLGAQVHPFAEIILGNVRPALVMLTVAVGLLLLLACVNIGNLLLLRAAGRVRDLSIRRALGASSAVIVRELLTESVLLAIAGGVAGVGLARLLLVGALRIAPAGLPRLDMVRQAGTPLMVATAITLITVLLFGLLPAVGTLRFDLSSPLRSDTRGGTEGRRLRRVRQVLVGSQIALALVVLAGAGLLLRTFTHLTAMNLGYTADHLSIIQVAPSYDRYIRECGGKPPSTDSVATALLGTCVDRNMSAFHDRAEESLKGAPGVVNASTVQITPFLGPSVFMMKVTADHQTDAESANNSWFAFESVGPDFFRTFQVPVLRGRAFTTADRAGGARVGIVTESVARSLWPGKDALGRGFYPLGVSRRDSLVTIVGIVPEVHYREHREGTPTIYLPYGQGYPQGTFAVRTRGPLGAALPDIGASLRAVDPDVVVTKAETMKDLIDPELAQPRLNALLLSGFALAAVLLAAIGLYGIMSQVVTQQTRELGVRMALGATSEQLRQMVLLQALIIAGAGALCGLAAALVGSRLLTTMLFEVSPNDPVTLIGVSILLLGVALLAAYLPARRATRIDPARALRAE